MSQKKFEHPNKYPPLDPLWNLIAYQADLKDTRKNVGKRITTSTNLTTPATLATSTTLTTVCDHSLMQFELCCNFELCHFEFCE